MRNEKNLVTEVGQVITGFEFSHEQYGECFYGFKIMVTRNSGDFDILPCIVSERVYNINESIENLNFYLEGNLRTHNDKDTGKLLIALYIEEMRLADENEINNQMSNNKVELTGYICKKNKPRLTPFGRTISDVILAINRKYGKSDYIPIILWNKNAKYIDSLDIGSEIKITGRLQSREYLKNKEISIAYEVSVQTIELKKPLISS